VLLMSWSTFRDRWPVFAGSIVTVCIGVALVQAALLSLITSVTADIPAGLPLAEERALRTGYTFATVVLSQILGVSAFVAVFIVSSTFAFTVAQRRRDLALLRVNGASKHQVRVLLLGEALLLGVVGSVLGMLVGLPVMRLRGPVAAVGDRGVAGRRCRCRALRRAGRVRACRQGPADGGASGYR
jgi:putative ABC transport system permease protein